MLMAIVGNLPDMGITPGEGGLNNTCVFNTYDLSCVMERVSYGEPRCESPRELAGKV